jgi:hypothetical protein
MGGNCDIYIYDDPDNPGTTLARPSPAMVERTKGLKVRNLTGRKVTFIFPAGLIADATGWEVGAGKTKHFNLAADADGLYYYQPLSITKTGVHATLGNSEPSIIVDP